MSRLKSFDLQGEDGNGEEGGIFHTNGDVITSPVILIKPFPISSNPAFKDYDRPNPIDTYPLEIHPDVSLNINFYYGTYRLPLDRGVLIVKFNYELKLRIPLDIAPNQMMNIS